MEIRFVEEVRDDLMTSKAWLDERQSGLGDELEAEFFAAVKVVRERPYTFATDETGYRPCRLKRFNAVMYFRIELDCLVITGLMVGGRDKSSMQGRG